MPQESIGDIVTCPVRSMIIGIQFFTSFWDNLDGQRRKNEFPGHQLFWSVDESNPIWND